MHSSLPCDSLCSGVRSSNIMVCLSFLVLVLKMLVTLNLTLSCFYDFMLSHRSPQTLFANGLWLVFKLGNTDFWKNRTKRDKEFLLSVCVSEGLRVCLCCAPHACSACGGQRRASVLGRHSGEVMWVQESQPRFPTGTASFLNHWAIRLFRDTVIFKLFLKFQFTFLCFQSHY